MQIHHRGSETNEKKELWHKYAHLESPSCAFVNALTLLLIALRADNYFRTEMGSGYEKGLQNELNLVDRIESSLVCFEEVCEIPVLLSLFIIVLDAPKWQLPEGIGHLYRLAMDCVAFKFTNSVNSTPPSRRNTWNPKEIGSVRYPIADVFSSACANHANAGQRILIRPSSSKPSADMTI